MLDEICGYLKNWFDRDMPKYNGSVSIVDGQITFSGGGMDIRQGQYFRIIGSVFNDGVWLYGTDPLIDEDFDGVVWLMAIPRQLVSIADEIAAWMEKYGGVDSSNLSPYSSESFAGYSYAKAQGAAISGGGRSVGWSDVFASRLARWKKL